MCASQLDRLARGQCGTLFGDVTADLPDSAALHVLRCGDGQPWRCSLDDMSIELGQISASDHHAEWANLHCVGIQPQLGSKEFVARARCKHEAISVDHKRLPVALNPGLDTIWGGREGQCFWAIAGQQGLVIERGQHAEQRGWFKDGLWHLKDRPGRSLEYCGRIFNNTGRRSKAHSGTGQAEPTQPNT